MHNCRGLCSESRMLINIYDNFMACILIPLQLYWQIKLVIVLAIAISATYVICGYGLLLLPWSCVGLLINAKNELQITRRDGTQLSAVSVVGDSVVTPYLTVIRFHQKNTTILSHIFSFQLIILPDALDAESYRQLRVWLRWAQHSRV